MVTSGLVLNEKCVSLDEVIEKRIEIKRIQRVNNGTRIWFQVLTTDNEFFQKWSSEMNNSDECMLLAEVGDQLDISYVVNGVRDDISGTIEPFIRNIILKAKLIFV